MATTERLDGRTLRAKAKREARREQIVVAAANCFASRGYYQTTVSDLIDAAGISRGTFYLYFESKEAIFHDLLDDFVKRLCNEITVVDPASGNQARVEIHGNITRAVDLLFDNPDLTTMLLNVANSVGGQTDKTLAQLNLYIYDMVEGALDNGAKWGLTRPCNTQIVAAAIVGSVKEVLYQHLVVKSTETVNRNEVAQALFDYGLRGLLPRGD
jgi:AcrR family transcriptional regulator